MGCIISVYVCRDRLEEVRSSQPLLVLSQASSELSSSADNSINSEDSSEESDVDSDVTPTRRSELEELRRMRRNIAQRKKLATPTITKEDESVYSSLSNDMYSKIGSPPESVAPPPAVAIHGGENSRRRSREELRQRLRECALTSESGSASVLEVIEPASSEEEEFKRSMAEINLGWAKALTPQKPSPPLAVNGDLRGSHSREKSAESSGGYDEDKSSSKRTFFQKITHWKRRGVRREPAGKAADDDEDLLEETKGHQQLKRAEEHILPETFDDDDEAMVERPKSAASGVLTIALGGGGGGGSGGCNGGGGEAEKRKSARKSLSPTWRRSLINGRIPGGGGEAVSVATSDDSGIVLRTESLSRTGSANFKLVSVGSGGDGEQPRSPPPNNQINDNAAAATAARLGKIEEVSVASSASRCSNSTVQEFLKPTSNNASRPSVGSTSALIVSPLSLVRKKSLESKAWYDVPSDEDREVLDEGDSLASIISNRGASSDED